MPYQPKSFRQFAAGATVAALVGFTFIPAADAAGFSDIQDNTHKDSILSLVQQGVIKGYEDGTFRPYTHITRGDAAVMVARTLHILDGQNISDTSFTDLHTVNPETKEAIAKLVNLGILNGYSPESFGPKDTITRAQMAKYLANAFDLLIKDGDTSFTDVNPYAVLAPYVAAIAEAGITVGKKDGTFGYHDPLNRGDFAAMIHRAQNHTEPAPEPVINPITIQGDAQGNILVNGQAKTYTVTLINSVSEKPIEGAILNVTFAENLETDFGPQRKVTVTNGYGESTIPYQSKDGHESEIKIVTDKNGNATFTLTGVNATATPIVFLDGSNQEWDTKGGIKIETQDGRFDEIEYHAIANPVTFTITPYQITIEGKRTNYAAITEWDEEGEITEHNGREYKVKVTKPDGSPYAGGTVNVGIDELLDGRLGNEPTGAYFPDFKDLPGRYLTQGQIKLDAKGEAVFVLASTDVNDSAKPIVWIDQNYANNCQSGTLESGEPMSDQSKVASTNYQPVRMDEGILGAKLTVSEESFGWEKTFTLAFLNQSGNRFNPGQEVKAHVTFGVINTGTHRIEINTSLLDNLQLKNAVDADNNKDTVTIEVGGRVTISGDTPVSKATLTAHGIEGITSLQVRGSAVLFDDVGQESNSVYVFTEYIEANLPYFYTAKVESALAKDIDHNGTSDHVELSFAKEVYNLEAGDFRITQNGVTYAANTIRKEETKLILSFPEEAFANGTTKLKYDPHYSGAAVLTDEFGNRVISFQIEFASEHISGNEENEDPIDEEIPEPGEEGDDSNSGDAPGEEDEGPDEKEENEPANPVENDENKDSGSTDKGNDKNKQEAESSGLGLIDLVTGLLGRR